MVTYNANVTQKKTSNSLPFTHSYFAVDQTCSAETSTVRVGRKIHEIPLKQRKTMKKQVMNCTFKQNCYFETKRQIDRT